MKRKTMHAKCFHNFVACGQEPMMKKLMVAIMLLVAVACNKTDPFERNRRRVENFRGRFTLSRVEWRGNFTADLDGDGICSGSIMSELTAADGNTGSLSRSKLVSIPYTDSDVNRFTMILPIQDGLLYDGPVSENMECKCAQLCLFQTEVVYKFDDKDNVSYYVESDMSLGSNVPLSHYWPLDFRFENGTARYIADAEFYDFSTRSTVTGQVEFIFERTGE